MLSAQDIVIDRLRINAKKGAAQKLSRELTYESWPLPLPANMRDAWVFVRELHVRGKAQDMRRETAQALESSLYRAVDGKLAAAQHAQAVRFETLPELLSFLLSDIVQGSAVRKWYWARWSYLIKKPRDEAVAQLLFENVEHLAAVVHQLDALGELKRVWLTLTKPAAAYIVRQLQKKTGIMSSPSPIKIKVYAHSENFLHASRQWVQQKQFGSPWVAVLEHLEVTDERVKLAAIMSAIEHVPLLLMQDADATLAAFVSVVLGKDDSVPDTQEKFHSLEQITHPLLTRPTAQPANLFSVQKNSNEHFEEYNLDNNSNDQRMNFASGSSDNIFLKPVLDHPDNIEEKEVKYSDVPLSVTTSKISLPEHEENNERQLSSPSDANPQVVEAEKKVAVGRNFYTQAGGFFYFINAISWLVSREQMQAGISAGIGNGWLWLYQLVAMVEEKFGLDRLDQPLKRFIADAASVRVEDLDQNAPDELIYSAWEKMETRFSEKTFWTVTENLLLIPAQVVTTSSHIDVYFPLSAVRLDVRLTGLDVNPGWVPWLGRVVNFHYIDSVNSSGVNHE